MASDASTNLPPDPVVEAYRKHVDETLLERNLRLSPTERLEQLQAFVGFLFDVKQARGRQPGPSDGDETD